MKQSKPHSDFWVQGNYVSDNPSPLQLALFRRGISSFVNILTNRVIPVKFSTAGRISATNGETIYISGDVSKDEIDTTVGLALHEGAHIVYSDFEMFKLIFKHIPQSTYDEATFKGFDKKTVESHVRLLVNYVEDRYIDYMVYKSAPGYRGYYKALYDDNFNTKIITTTLKSSAFRDETYESYKYRLINLTNPNTDLDALNGLREISEILDLKRINRLKTPNDRLLVALEIYDVILDSVGDFKKKKPKKSKKPFSLFDNCNPTQQGDSDKLQPNDDSSEWPMKKNDDSDTSDDNPKTENIEEDDFDLSEIFGGVVNEIGKNPSSCNESQTTNKDVELDDISKRQLSKAIKEFERQQDFTLGKHQKKQLDEEIAREVSVLEEAGVSTVKIAPEFGITNECVVVEKMTKAILQSDAFVLGACDAHMLNQVEHGLILGKRLGKKLKVRGESRKTVFNRKRSGKLDKRILSELGYGAENVFYKMEIDSYKDAFLHLSVDASGSMSGIKFENALTCAVAIAKAASMTNNIHVVISFRVNANNRLPCVVLAYDSKIDKISKIKSLFPYLISHSGTPEGLCFEAILDRIQPSSAECDSYFLNFSDGEPCFHTDRINYSGERAEDHTRKQMNKILKKGVNVISYFIGDKNSECRKFKNIYGGNSRFIDVTNITQVANTMNKEFLKK